MEMDAMVFKTLWSKKLISKIVSRLIRNKLGMTNIRVDFDELDLASSGDSETVTLNTSATITISKDELMNLLKGVL